MEVKSIKNPTFLDEIREFPGGEKTQLCIQCGTCSASCPHADKMEYTPRQLIAMIRANMRKEVLSSNAIWYCLSCYLCSVRCPRGIEQTHLMHILQSLAVRHNLIISKNRTFIMEKSFSDFVYSIGNVPESSFMTWYYWLSNPWRALKMLPVAISLIKHGRMGIKAKRLSHEAEKQLKSIIDKAEEIGGV